MKRPILNWMIVLAGAVGLAASNTRTAATWQVLQDCHLADCPVAKGDTLHVEQAGHEYTFRLYFVDAPKTCDNDADLIAEQAAYFGVSHDRITELGRIAADFTAHQINDHFTIVTRWEEAGSRDKSPHYYAYVIADGHDLGELLVQNGLARLVGERSISPAGNPARSVERALQAMEDQAKQSHLGGWSSANFKIGLHAAIGTDQTHRISISTGDRHNSHCPLFNASGTRACTPDEGRPCPICGG